MFSNLSSPAIIFILVTSLCLYLLIVGLVYAKKFFGSGHRLFGQPSIQSASAAPSTVRSWQEAGNLPALIDKPADHPAEQAGTYEEAPEEADFDIVEEEGATTLLKEAEKVVGDIQDVVDNIASSPANPEEVYTKIHAIVSNYSIFLDTEYYEAINSFIATTVERDCELVLTEDELHGLWLEQAA